MSRRRFNSTSGEKGQYGITIYRGPRATVYACPCCRHTEQFTSGRPGVGRGHGLREGSGCWSRMVAHIRREHPEQPKRIITGA